jgi:DNA helicase IV
VVLPIAKAKGLEFDAVVLVEPAEGVAEQRRPSTLAATRRCRRHFVFVDQPARITTG